MEDYSEILDLAIATARKAGNFVREARKAGLHIDAKSRIDFVSDKDRMSEDMIREAIHNKFPSHLFFGEESVYGETLEDEARQIREFKDEDYIWVVDPIDGTVNYIHDYPQYAISIAVVHHREIVVGVIYDAFRQETFYAQKGGGAFMDGVPIHVSTTELAADSIITTSMPTFSMKVRDEMVMRLPDVADGFQSMRIWNCAAVSLASVACGRTDANYESGIHIWDMAAGVVIVREAGGAVSQLNGGEYELTQMDVIATNGKIHGETVGILNVKH